MSGAAREPYNPLVRIHPRWTALACWIIVAGLMLYEYRLAIAALKVFDGDDALRLVQVRDLMAGQSWFDTTQYRINPPAGGMMHWSRLIDLPIALSIRTLMLFVEQPVAERFVMALYPMALLGLLFFAVKMWLSTYGSRPLTHVGLIVLATSSTMLFQFAPMRIDHHSWQIILAVVVMGFAVRKPSATSGAMAGLFMANYLSISIEGAAFMLVFGAIFAVDWILDRRSGPRFLAYCAALAVASVLLVSITKGPWTLGASYCDALSLPYTSALCALAAATAIAWRVFGDARPIHRMAILAIGGIAGLIAFGLSDASCFAGPFEALDPKVRLLWYQNVKEGLPIWDQSQLRQLHLFGPVIVALGGTIWAWVRAEDEASRHRWRTTLFALIGGTAIAVMVFRTMSVAHIYAIPGIAWLIVMLGHKARQLGSPIIRVAATLAVLAMAPLIVNWVAMVFLSAGKPDTAVTVAAKPDPTLKRVVSCLDGGSLDQLRALPPALLFAPLDVSPFLLAYSPHSVVATGHHRNQRAMREVIDGYLLPQSEARKVIEASGARYLAACQNAPEFYNFRYMSHDGLAADLYRGKVPDWLEAIQPPGDSRISIYRVRHPGRRNAD
ncbi:hypothetical protein FSZ31_01670 [Sphingorhabdus soli]|uniref:AcrB/AcrD/AcrF family protein n=1 Tax=Flavisphingopyxis soli TaxID=2601267 RepID=A0A5C6UR65_9SPHN|nr:hypothetical protein [Sphingorhabdus soli]TXC73485.1 hypothetical protein FSZ31_01670 [Sphingorhabdus soli]